MAIGESPSHPAPLETPCFFRSIAGLFAYTFGLYRLPFLRDPDVAMGIAVKTLLDDVPADEPAEQRAARMKEFPAKYVPFASHFAEDIEISFDFFNALYQGVKATTNTEISAVDKAVWDRAAKYLELRR